MGAQELQKCSFEGVQKLVVSRFDLILLASNIVIGSLIDIDFTGGYWVLLFNTILSGIGYILLAYSLAEMTSALPFSGGIYGIVRAFLHPFMGFYISVFELMINLFYLAFSVHSLASLPKQAGTVESDSNFLVFCLLVYITIFIVCLLGGKVFWYTNNILGLLCIVIICIYIIGAIPTANFSSWKHTDGPFTFNEVMKRLPGPSLTYLGIQYLPLNSKFTKDPKNDTPHVMIWTVAIIFALCISVITVACSQYPGYDALAEEDHPLTFGLAVIFGISLSQAHYLGFPGLFATCFTFLYCFGRQASSMASSGLLPEILKLELPIVNTPYIALLCVTISCMILNIFLYYYENDLLHRYIRICGLSTYIVFISFFIAYIRFRKNYSTLQRSISSPFGLIGAYLGIIIFTICMISALVFQDRGYSEFILLVIVSITIIVFYVWVLGTQEFSEEEKNELFKAYLISANRQAKNRVRKGGNRKAVKYSTSALSDSGHRGGNKSLSDNGSDGKSSDVVNDNGVYPQNDPEADLVSDPEVGDLTETRNISSSVTGRKISIHFSVNQEVKTKRNLRSSMVWSGVMVRKVLPTVTNTETNDSILESCENADLSSP